MRDFLFLVAVIAIGVFAWRALQKKQARDAEDAIVNGRMICPNCGSRGNPWYRTRGSLAVEIVLWLCFIIPGLIYSVWRASTKEPVCRSCQQPGLVDINSPRGRQLASDFGPSSSSPP